MSLQHFIIAIPSLLLAIILHEVMHGYVAYRLGDPTARQMGRLTLNPISHIDLFGSIIMPAMLYIIKAPVLFAYAKPVPVNIFRLRNPKKDMAWVAGAGPLTNLTLAAVSGLLFRFLIMFLPADSGLIIMVYLSVRINVLLALFNLIPIPPLDGGRILVGLLPVELAVQVSRIELYGMYLIFGLFLLQPLGALKPFWHFNSLLSNIFLGV